MSEPEQSLRSRLSHDLRTPLTVISGYAELLQLRADEATRFQAAGEIFRAAQLLSARLDDVIERLASAEEAFQREAPADEAETAPPARILVCDDDAALRSLLRVTFPAADFEVVDAETGREALERIDSRPPDVVVLDWQLPDTSGAEVLAALRERYPHLPVVVLTAYAPAAEQAPGAAAFLTKPFSPVELLDVVASLLRV